MEEMREPTETHRGGGNAMDTRDMTVSPVVAPNQGRTSEAAPTNSAKAPNANKPTGMSATTTATITTENNNNVNSIGGNTTVTTKTTTASNNKSTKAGGPPNRGMGPSSYPSGKGPYPGAPRGTNGSTYPTLPYGFDPHYRGPPAMYYAPPPGAYPGYPQAYAPYGPPPPYPPSFNNNEKSKPHKKRSIGQSQSQQQPFIAPSNLSASGSLSNNTVSFENATAPPPLVDSGMDTATTKTSHKNNNHTRDGSLASTDSSNMSVGGHSTSSIATGGTAENHLTRASPKRRRGTEGNAISVDIGDQNNNRFQKLSVKEQEATNIFLSLSTSPINSEDSEDVKETPVKNNTSKKAATTSKKAKPPKVETGFASAFETRSATKPSSIDRSNETPTPPLPAGGHVDNDLMTDEQLLNRHLRGQSFTPLPHLDGISPTAAGVVSGSGSFPTISNQLSWSIAGDAPSLGDLAEWEEHVSRGSFRPDSQMSNGSGGGDVGVRNNSPHSFTLWRDDPHVAMSALSPSGDIEAHHGGEVGSAPLPLFLSQQLDENVLALRHSLSTDSKDPENLPHGTGKKGKQGGAHFAAPEQYGRKPMAQYPPSMNKPGGSRMPPTPVFSFEQRDDLYGSSSSTRPVLANTSDRRDGPPPELYFSYGMTPQQITSGGATAGDRVRNLRGRPSSHHAPMPFHVAAHSNPLNLTSPIGLSYTTMPPSNSPHRLLNPGSIDSKHKCVALKPPIPSKFQGDMEKYKATNIPEFTSLVNFPAHMSQKQSVNLPDNMRCCVMCGNACPCLSGGKNKLKANKKEKGINGKDPNDFAIIPSQNKGLCTLCDVNVWVIIQSGTEIKWCKGCKNFRPWAAFGDKGLATKCLRCRERQREKYALQKDAKERARRLSKQQRAAKV